MKLVGTGFLTMTKTLWTTGQGGSVVQETFFKTTHPRPELNDNVWGCNAGAVSENGAVGFLCNSAEHGYHVQQDHMIRVLFPTQEMAVEFEHKRLQRQLQSAADMLRRFEKTHGLPHDHTDAHRRF